VNVRHLKIDDRLDNGVEHLGDEDQPDGEGQAGPCRGTYPKHGANDDGGDRSREVNPHVALRPDRMPDTLASERKAAQERLQTPGPWVWFKRPKRRTHGGHPPVGS
jgi:hypothetical protein